MKELFKAILGVVGLSWLFGPKASKGVPTTRDLKVRPRVVKVAPLVGAAIARYKPTMPFALALATLHVESEGSQFAKSTFDRPPYHAYGYMQLLPDTAKNYFAKGPYAGQGRDIYDPEANIDAGIHLLSDLYKRWGTWERALTAYNAGEGRLKKNKDSIRWKYVSAVLSKVYLYTTL